jgi:hypothetical protein
MADAIVTQLVVETLTSLAVLPDARVSQVVVEVLTSQAAAPVAPERVETYVWGPL